MLDFIMISGIATTIIKGVCNVITIKNIKKRGYINYSKSSNISKIGHFVCNFMPGINLLIASAYIVISSVLLYGNPEKIEKFLLEKHIIRNPTDELNHVNYLKNQMDKQSFTDAMILDGASKEIINSELEFAKKEMYSDYYELNDKKYHELQAMSNTELLLKDIELHNGLSLAEKKKLFSSYVRDFQCNNENAKPKAIQKTYKIVANRKTNV